MPTTVLWALSAQIRRGTPESGFKIEVTKKSFYKTMCSYILHCKKIRKILLIFDREITLKVKFGYFVTRLQSSAKHPGALIKSGFDGSFCKTF